MKKYQVKCQEMGCGKVLGVLELPDKTPVKDQASGYYCQDWEEARGQHPIERGSARGGVRSAGHPAASLQGEAGGQEDRRPV
jgi:hypothetical protein